LKALLYLRPGRPRDADAPGSKRGGKRKRAPGEAAAAAAANLGVVAADGARKRRGRAAPEQGPVTRSAPRGGAPGAPGAGAPGAGRGKVVGEETAALALLLLDHDKPVRPLLQAEHKTVGTQEYT
jgi:hypothetical protein